MKLIPFFIILCSTLAGAVEPPFPSSAILNAALGNPLPAQTRSQLDENLKAYPSCDFLYLPLLKLRDPQAFKDYISRSGQDSLLLLYLLREREAYAKELEGARLGPMEILKRLFWVNKIEPKAGACPAGIRASRVVFDGYAEEISEECYAFALSYHSGDTARTESVEWCGPLVKDEAMESLPELMKKYSIPFLHRSTIVNKDTDTFKAGEPAKGKSTEKKDGKNP